MLTGRRIGYLILGSVTLICWVCAFIIAHLPGIGVSIDLNFVGYPAFLGFVSLVIILVLWVIGQAKKEKARKRTTPVYNLPPTQKVDSVVFRPTPAAPAFKQREGIPSPSSASPNEKMGGSLSRLGNYRLVRLLGEGGFAEVYLGEHIHLGTEAAIKVLHTKLTSDDVDQFRTEARTIARLKHHRIVRVLDFGVEGKIPFLVMDYAPMGTLRQRYPRGTVLQVPAIVRYVKQVSSALQYAHDQKIIHRDIKPENMLLETNDDILLSDFGIALVAQSSRYQSTQDVIGTVAYMAPEQIQGKPRPASDQYSLAIVVYEWLSGRRPFHGSFTEMCAQHISALPPPLRGKIPTISSAVEQVVLKALAKDPKERFGSVREFAKALEQAAH